MTLRVSTSDNYKSSRDNLAHKTVAHYLDSREKNISSCDSFAFHPTVAQISTVIKAIHNKVADNRAAFGTISQAQTATKYKILHNFFARFIERTYLHIAVLAGLCAAKSNRAPSKTRAKKFNHKFLFPTNIISMQ